jgi:outer membrane lipoprotein-sorting protein
MRRLLLFISVIHICGALAAQQDPIATKILDRFSEKALAAPSITMEFDLKIHDAAEQTDQTLEGVVYIKKGFYKLEIPDNIIWCNGEAVWTLSPEVEEVTITLPDNSDNTFISDPASLFTMYKQGFKYRLVEGDINRSIIDLYPEDLKADFSRIRLLIDNNSNLKEAEYKRKDGITMYIIVSSYNLKSGYPDSFFEFDQKKYKNIDIIDMR